MIGMDNDVFANGAGVPAAARTVSRKDVLVVDPDEHASALLRRYLEAQGWSVDVRDARSTARQWGTAIEASILLLTLGDDDPDAFELLASVAAHAVDAHVVVCAAESLGRVLSTVDARALGVERVLAPFPRFSELVRVLDEIENDARGAADPRAEDSIATARERS